jgi:hypothetical protein
MQKMAVEVLHGLLYNTAECYLDDAITWGKTEDELLANIELLLCRFTEKNINLNPKKAKIGMSQIEYTGHVLTENGLKFSDKKIDKVINFKQPKTQKELRSFLGLTNYFRQHIQNYSTIVRPLLDIVKVYKPRQVVRWDDTTLHAFELIKAAINACPHLYFLQDDLPTYLHTDASDYGVGAYLYQLKEIEELPIAFLSKTFTAEQKRWSVPDKECYAIIYAFKKLEHYIRDRYFVLRTDHKNLTYVDLENSGKVRRWKLLMQQYNFSIEYIKGEDNIPADGFSRLMERDVDTDNLLTEVLRPISEPLLRLSGRKRVRWEDGEPMPVNPEDEPTVVHQEHSLRDVAGSGQLRDVAGDDPDDDGNGTQTGQPPPPIVEDVQDDTTQPTSKYKRVYYKIIAKCHNSMVGHMGVDKTLLRLQNMAEVRTLTEPWLNMRKDVRYFIKMCACCQKMAVLKPLIHTHPFTVASLEVMDRVAVDATGKLPTDKDGNQYIISVIDHFSRFIELYAVKDLEARTFATCLLDWVGRYGAPSELLSDKGTNFANKIIKELCQIIGTEKTFTMTASKEENSIVERSIKEIRRHLRAIIFSRNLIDDWSVILPLVQRILNADVKDALGVSPAQILFGNAVQLDRRILLDIVPRDTNGNNMRLSDYVSKLINKQKEIIRQAQASQVAKDDSFIQKRNQQNTNIVEYPINSYVLVEYRNGPPNSLVTRWEGPMRIVNKMGSKYTLQNLVTSECSDYHVTKLKEFRYDPEITDPSLVANRDVQAWEIDKVITHNGDIHGSRKDLDFLVKWKGYDDIYNRWLPWEEVRQTQQLRNYLRENNFRHLLSRVEI